MRMKDCENCEYRKMIAKMFDIHIWGDDCWINCKKENEDGTEQTAD